MSTLPTSSTKTFARSRTIALILTRRVAPVVGVITVTGLLTFAFGSVALIAGLVLGWQELTYIAVTLLAAFAVAALFLFGRSTYRVEIALSPPRVVVGERALGRLAVSNSGQRNLLPALMELPVGEGVAEFAIPSLKPGEEHEEVFAVPTARRAVIVAGPAVSVRGDQLGMWRRLVKWAEPEDLFVHPVTVPLAPTAAGLVRDLEGQVTKKITNNDLSFHALRPYEAGDDRRNVHWRSTARTGVLMVRQFEETRRSQLTIVHTESARFYADADEFELAVSVMASMAAQVIRDGTQMSVVTENRRLRTHSPTAVLDDSCRLELSPDSPASARELVRDATRRLPPPSVLIIIAGSGMATAEYRSISLLFPNDTTMLVFRMDTSAQPSVATVAGFQVITVGTLSDLTKVLRRAGG